MGFAAQPLLEPVQEERARPDQEPAVQIRPRDVEREPERDPRAVAAPVDLQQVQERRQQHERVHLRANGREARVDQQQRQHRHRRRDGQSHPSRAVDPPTGREEPQQQRVAQRDQPAAVEPARHAVADRAGRPLVVDGRDHGGRVRERVAQREPPERERLAEQRHLVPEIRVDHRARHPVHGHRSEAEHRRNSLQRVEPARGAVLELRRRFAQRHPRSRAAVWIPERGGAKSRAASRRRAKSIGWDQRAERRPAPGLTPPASGLESGSGPPPHGEWRPIREIVANSSISEGNRARDSAKSLLRGAGG